MGENPAQAQVVVHPANERLTEECTELRRLLQFLTPFEGPSQQLVGNELFFKEADKDVLMRMIRENTSEGDRAEPPEGLPEDLRFLFYEIIENV